MNNSVREKINYFESLVSKPETKEPEYEEPEYEDTDFTESINYFEEWVNFYRNNYKVSEACAYIMMYIEPRTRGTHEYLLRIARADQAGQLPDMNVFLKGDDTETLEALGF